MTEEVGSPAEVPAPEQPVTATVAPEVQAPESTTPEAAPKTFSQEELDAAIGKRLAREQRKWEREQAQRAQAPVTPAAPVTPEQFTSTDEYVDALATQRAQELVAQREQQRQQTEVLDTFHEKEEEARGKYDDFDQVAYNPNLPITQVMAQAIQASDVGPDVAYHLGANPKEAERISKLSPLQQAKEIGKLEAKLADSPPVKKTSTAPAPITPVTARNSGDASYDTTDPRSMKMTMAEWAAADNARTAKMLEARNR